MTELQRIKYGFFYLVGSMIEFSVGVILWLMVSPWAVLLFAFAYVSCVGALVQACKLFNMKVDQINELRKQNGNNAY